MNENGNLVEKLYTLHRINAAIVSELDINKVLSRIVEAAIYLTKGEEATIFLLDKSTNALYVRAQKGVGEPHANLLRVRGSDSVVVAVFSEGKALRLGGNAIKVATGYLARSMLGVPLIARGHKLGALSVINWKSPRHFTREDEFMLRTMASQAAIAIENAHLFVEAESLALTDSLTGLANRRAFDMALDKEIARAKRYRIPLSLIMLDIDDFKIYNDTYGHLAGDAQLKALADLQSRNLRESDIIARYGGDEFVLLAPHTDREGALHLAERIRMDAVSSAPYVKDDQEPIPGYSVSLGVAAFANGTEEAEELVMAADHGVMAAKDAGKNRVCFWPNN
jgi:diguanylate cyclase (GGDEF)-like protein